MIRSLRAIDTRCWLLTGHSLLQRPALEVANRVVSYSDLRERTFQLAVTLWKYELSDQPPLAAVFGYRSVTALANSLPLLCAILDAFH